MTIEPPSAPDKPEIKTPGQGVLDQPFVLKDYFVLLPALVSDLVEDRRGIPQGELPRPRFAPDPRWPTFARKAAASCISPHPLAASIPRPLVTLSRLGIEAGWHDLTKAQLEKQLKPQIAESR